MTQWFDDRSTARSSNPKVYVNFQDVNTGNWVYPGIGDAHDCSTKPIVYQFLKPGRYTVRIQTTIGGSTYLRRSGHRGHLRPHHRSRPGHHAVLAAVTQDGRL